MNRQLRFRFSLRMLLLAMLVLGLFLGWYGREWDRLRRQRAIATQFQSRGGYVAYDPKLPAPNQKNSPGQPLSRVAGRMLFGEDAFAHIDTVWLKDSKPGDFELFINLPQLKGLLLKQPPDDCLEQLVRNRKLESLDLQHFRLNRARFELLQRLQHLNTLSLTGNEVDDEALESLALLHQLKTLMLDGTNLTSQGLRRVAELEHLQRLYVSASKTIDDRAIGELKPLKNLRTLSLVGTSTTSAALEHIGDMKELRTLDLSHTPLTDSGFENLAESQLAELTVFGTAVGSQSLPQIAKMRSLRRLDLGGRNSPLTNSDLAPLAKLTELRNLSISTNGITEEALTHLSSLRNLRSLYLNSKAISKAAAVRLQSDLPHCTISGSDVAGSYELPAPQPSPDEPN
ncbi:leucine-rich repeat domain-containing protein [Anatilimnocola floriformis]|uniref:leucine-rich repeat domain-containing protein n=1 Tax=Anatilimnocola floriformis TaxID=2948575 RepID=UPI0020C253D2|nr:hypothetical protein [Anatilimnocola floriformis]